MDVDEILAKILTDITNMRLKIRLFHCYQDEIARIGRSAGMEVDHLALVVAWFHGPASYVNRTRAGDVFELGRGGNLPASAPVNDDALVVSWGRQSDNWHARVLAQGPPRLRGLAAFRRANFNT